MTATIWKFEIPPQGNIELRMPLNADILSVQVQGTKPVLWAKVEDNHDLETRYFQLHPTGSEIPEYWRLGFVGTIQLNGLVFHLFEVINLNGYL